MKPVIVLLLLLASAPAWAGSPLTPADFQAAIDRELAGVQRGGRLDVTVNDDGTATVTYTRTDGRQVRRTVLLPERRDDALETVALLASSLVRDPTAGLEDEPPARPALQPTRPASAAPPPASAPPAPRAEVRVVPFGLGLVPPLSTNLIYGEPVAHGLALHLAAGYSRGVRGASLAGAVDVQDGDVLGIEVAGAVNVTTGAVRGVQIAGAVNVTTGSVGGLQLAGAVNVADDLRGLQIAGGLNVVDESRGLQLAPFNVSHRQRGLQLGVVNYSDDAEHGVSIGVFSIVPRGITEVDAVAESYGGLSLVLRHGRRYFYNLYGVGTTVSDGDTAQLGGLGLGGRVKRGSLLGAPADLDLDVMCWSAHGDAIATDAALLNRARLTLGVHVGGWITLFAGAAMNVFVADNGEQGDVFHPSLDRMWLNGDVTTRLWPSFYAGVRLQ